MALWEAAARLYFSYVPLEKGKWRVWKAVEDRLDTRRLPKGKVWISPGFWMRIDPEDSIGCFLYFWRQWEPNETRLIKQILRPGDTFVDIGANIGYFTLVAAGTVGDSGKVIAIEATPPTAERLRENVALNRCTNVVVEHCAVGSEDGIDVRINHIHQSNCGMNTIRPGSDGPGWTVPCRRLDHLLPSAPIRLIKIDIEGAELLALEGFAGRLAEPNAPDLLVEITPDYLSAFGHSSRQLVKLLHDSGYRAYRLRRGRLAPLTASEEREGSAMMAFFSKHPIPASLT